MCSFFSLCEIPRSTRERKKPTTQQKELVKGMRSLFQLKRENKIRAQVQISLIEGEMRD